MNPINLFEKLNQINRAPMLGERLNETQMLLVALSTTVLLAKEKELPKEHYQWTRTFLQFMRDDNGQPLPNIQGMLKKMDEFETRNKIEDEIPVIEFSDTSSDNDGDGEEFDFILTSTRNRGQPQIIIDNIDDDQVGSENSADSPANAQTNLSYCLPTSKIVRNRKLQNSEHN